MTDGVKGELHTMIVSDDDIAFHWCMLTVEVEETEGKVLLKMIADLTSTHKDSPSPSR